MAKKLQWNQKPENKAKAEQMAANARAKKNAKPLISENRLIERHKELQMQVNFRLREIDEEINTLQQERKQLVDTFNLGNE